ncbi:MAG: hypothetical protein IT249_02445 [Chitinophagaceae bacterium]|nr:hypothetical protein [Chitinophagaceae bacterium]
MSEFWKEAFKGKQEMWELEPAKSTVCQRVHPGVTLRQWRCVLAGLLPKNYLFRYNNSHVIYTMPV